VWYNAAQEHTAMTNLTRQPALWNPSPLRDQLADFWLWAGVRLTAGGFMAGRPAS
jgi:hypothetical protein